MSDTTYFPSAKVRLNIRLDEFGDKSVKKQKPKGKPIDTHKGTSANRTGLTVVPDPGDTGAQRFLISDGGGGTTAGPQDRESSEDGYTYATGSIIPAEANWAANGIRSADTLSFTIKFKDFPLDPRVVRAAGVKFFLGCVSATDFARGMRGKTRAEDPVYNKASGVVPMAVIPDTYMFKNQPRSNLRFEGFVDKWEVEFTESGEPVIRIECRDNTQLFIDTQAPANLTIDHKKPIHEAAAYYLSNFAQMRGMKVEYRPSTEEAPSLEGRVSPMSLHPKGGVAPTQGGGAQEKLNLWDFLTDTVGKIGHSIRVEGTTVIIQHTASLERTANKTTTKPTRPEDSFQTRTLDDGETLEFRRFIYGNNLQSFKLSRAYGAWQPKNIAVSSYNPATKKRIRVRFPEKADRAVNSLPGDGGTEEKWLELRFDGVTDENTLKLIAESTFYSLGKREVTTTIKTLNLASFGGNNVDPDILDMQAGDTFEVRVGQEHKDQNTPSRLTTAISGGEAGMKILTSLGFGDDFASAYLKQYANVGFPNLYRLRTMTAGWDAETGITLSLQGINYVEAHVDPNTKANPPSTKTNNQDGAAKANAATAKAAAEQAKKAKTFADPAGNKYLPTANGLYVDPATGETFTAAEMKARLNTGSGRGEL